MPKHKPFVPKPETLVPKHKPLVPKHKPSVPKHTPPVPKHEPFVPKPKPRVPKPNPLVPQHESRIWPHDAPFPSLSANRPRSIPPRNVTGAVLNHSAFALVVIAADVITRPPCAPHAPPTRSRSAKL